MAVPHSPWFGINSHKTLTSLGTVRHSEASYKGLIWGVAPYSRCSGVSCEEAHPPSGGDPCQGTLGRDGVTTWGRHGVLLSGLGGARGAEVPSGYCPRKTGLLTPAAPAPLLAVRAAGAHTACSEPAPHQVGTVQTLRKLRASGDCPPTPTPPASQNPAAGLVSPTLCFSPRTSLHPQFLP